MRRFLLGNSKKSVEHSYYWVTIGGLLNAGQSALLLMVISRTNKAEDCAIYSIGYAIACLALSLGNFGIRNYQVTDVIEKYSFQTYLSTRLVTDIGLLFIVVGYVVRGILSLGYTADKCFTILLLGLLKLMDSIEDVFHGLYQKKQRLDIAARCQTIRYMIMLSAFSISLIISHNLNVSSSIAFLCSIICLLYTLSVTLGYFNVNCQINLRDKKIIHLLLDCFGLFSGGFFSIYIANAPKYVIDQVCTWEIQACFNYIFMPVYIVSVLNSFIYQPLLTRLARLYNQGNSRDFVKLFVVQIFIIIGLVVVILLGGNLFGIPVLNILYNTDLKNYKNSFMILLIGSGFLAIQGYLAAIITIMRKQNWLLIGYVIPAVAILIISKPIIMAYNIIGASLLYCGIVFLQMMIFVIQFFFFYLKRNERLNYFE